MSDKCDWGCPRAPLWSKLEALQRYFSADNDFGTSQIVGRVAVTDLLFGRFSELIWAKKQNILSKTDVHRWL